jgi:hypothetical protein
MVDAVHLVVTMQLVHDPASSATRRVSEATRDMIQPSAALSLLNTAGSVLPPRSRITTTTRRFPF